MNLRFQQGQSMVEYLMVVTSLVTLILLSNEGCEGYDSCLSKVLNVMHDNYDGYSSSISAVQKYGEYEAKGEPIEGGGNNNGGGSSGGSGSGNTGGIELNPEGLTEVTELRSSDGFNTFGTLQSDGTVIDANGNIIGNYSELDGTLTLNSGDNIGVNLHTVVLDEDGNILYMRAVTDIFNRVYSWAYVSKASGKVSNSLNLEEMDITGYITQPAFKVIKNGVEQPGRVLNGEYYPGVFAANVSPTPLNPSGEVVYWDDLDICSVMVLNWDDDVDTSQSDEDIYQEQLAIFSDDDKNLGQMDMTDYFLQTSEDPTASEPNDCPSARIISQP